MPELTFDPALIDLRNLAVALAAGFLIGFEREHTHVAEARARSFAGARTFSLAALAGGLCGQLDAGFLLAAVAAAVIGGLTIAAHWAVARTEPRSGGTTEIALLATYLLGVAAGRGEVLIAAAGAVAVTAMLSIKEIVQRWATALSEEELYAALRLLAISVIVLPALPDEAFGPYDALNPRSIWLLVVFISGLSFLGYWLMKLAGAGRGAGADRRDRRAGVIDSDNAVAFAVCERRRRRA
ncbi:MAG: MgtC/SapB family protein [Parvularculaceae bacterium]